MSKQSEIHKELEEAKQEAANWKSCFLEAHKENQRLRRSRSALKGVITRLKDQLAFYK